MFSPYFAVSAVVMRRFVGVIAVAVLPVVAMAQQVDNAVFDLTLRGLTAGQLHVNGKLVGNAYAAKGVLQSSGLLGMVRKVRYDASVSGRYAGGKYTPVSYAEKADTSKRQSESVMAYRAGVPQVTTYNPPRDPRPGDVDPATQGGTIDPLTALYAVVRDVPAAEACTLKVTLFDGRRRSQVVLSPAETAGKGVTCAGEYRRLAGFSDKEMAEKVRFPFRLTYAPAGQGMLRVVEISMDTLYGKGALKRR
ncbi:DUF3108 domain-containing protein [Phaeovulum sp.]|uniref:DUF3108 domain-containing protein n=1 Tax=Phaeovulum sp. TaxID=2934796 RepID=UPI0039E45CA9